MAFLNKIIGLILICFSQYVIASNVETEKIWPQIPFVAGANLCNTLHEANTTRSANRKEYISDTISLMKYGASPIEALILLGQFDHFYSLHQYESEQKLKISLEAFFKSQLQKLLVYHNPKKVKFEFNNSLDVLKLKTKLKETQNKNVNPTEETLLLSKSVDYIINGTFGFTADCKSQIYISVELLNLKSGKLVSYSAMGSLTFAVNEVAQQVFDHFQKIELPSTLELANGKKLILLGTPTGRFTDKVDWQTAHRACLSMKGRLPSTQEVKDISLLGKYSGGLTLIKHGNYSISGENNVYVSDFVGQEDQNFRLISDKTAYYFCVKD